MIRMILGTLASLALVQASLAQAGGSQRWTAGFGQGTSEAIIRNRAGSDFNLYCPAGLEDTTPGFFYHPKAQDFQADQDVLVKVVVDRRDFTFATKEGQFQANDKAGKDQIRALAIALIKSKAERFSIELPTLGTKDVFSLKNVRKALGGEANSTILDDCLQN